MLGHFADPLDGISFTTGNTFVLRIVIGQIPGYHRTTGANLIQGVVCHNRKAFTRPEIQIAIALAAYSAVSVKRLQKQLAGLSAGVQVIGLKHIMNRMSLGSDRRRTGIDPIQFRQEGLIQQIPLRTCKDIVLATLIDDVFAKLDASSTSAGDLVDAVFLGDFIVIGNKIIAIRSAQKLLDAGDRCFGDRHILEGAADMPQERLQKSLCIFCTINDHTDRQKTVRQFGYKAEGVPSMLLIKFFSFYQNLPGVFPLGATAVFVFCIIIEQHTFHFVKQHISFLRYNLYLLDPYATIYNTTDVPKMGC